MTNGEKIKEIFPDMKITLCESYVQVIGENYEFSNTYPLKWWNAEYKEPTTKDDIRACKICVHSKDGKCAGTEECHGCMWDSKYSPKNDLVVDCVSRQEVDRLACRYLKEPTDNHVAFYEDFLELPSVTPIRPKGHWIDHSDEGYVECPKCGSATNCDDNIADLHFCFSCGADMREVEE